MQFKFKHAIIIPESVSMYAFCFTTTFTRPIQIKEPSGVLLSSQHT